MINIDKGGKDVMRVFGNSIEFWLGIVGKVFRGSEGWVEVRWEVLGEFLVFVIIGKNIMLWYVSLI